MLRSLKEFFGYKLRATDGEIGRVRDFLLDDQEWVIRYLVADTGGWLSDRLVIISPALLGQAERDSRILSVDLSREQVRSSPPIEAEQPVSRQKEIELSQYYGWPMYWDPAMATAGAGAMAGPWMAPAPVERQAAGRSEPQGDPHLRSAREIIGYHVEASDGAIGHVEDLVIDDGGWAVQYVVVDTKNWWPAKKVVLLPMWISGVSWELRQVRFDLPKETIRNGPRFDPAAPINHEDEIRLYDYYGRPRGREA